MRYTSVFLVILLSLSVGSCDGTGRVLREIDGTWTVRSVRYTGQLDGRPARPDSVLAPTSLIFAFASCKRKANKSRDCDAWLRKDGKEAYLGYAITRRGTQELAKLDINTGPIPSDPELQELRRQFAGGYEVVTLTDDQLVMVSGAGLALNQGYGRMEVTLSR